MTLLLSGLALGAVYALVAVGYNVVFISSKSFNFAHAQLIMVGAFVTMTATVTWSLPGWLVVLVATSVVGLLAAVEERVAVRPVPDTHSQLVTTLGVATLLNGATQLIWGSEPRTVPFIGSDEITSFLGGRVYPVEIALIVLAIVMVVVLSLLAKRLMVGLALVGISQDPEAAQLRGVDVRKLAFGAFVLAGVLAGLAGVFVGPKTFAVTTLGLSLALKGFVALAIGGFGSLYGGLIGGFVVGVVEQFAARYAGSEFSNLSVFLILIVVLMVKPNGLLGRSHERVV